MYYSNKTKICIFIVVLLVLGFGICGIGIIKEQTRQEQIQNKILSMGEESFQLVLTNTDVLQDIAAPVEIKWWFQEENQTYYLFLPSHYEKGLYYVFNLYDYVLINDNRVEPGDGFELDNGRYILQMPDGAEITLEVMHSRHLASVFIQTDSRNLAYIQEAKQNVDSGQYTLIDKEGNKSSSGKIEKFHCRGNMTFDAADKKSYAIKLKDKTGILNLGIEKDWLLLANAFDETLSKNGIAAEVGNVMGMDYVPKMEYVDLYIDGEYQGNYQLSEKVEIGEDRLNIRNLEDEMDALNPDVDFASLESVEMPVEDIPVVKWVDGLKVPENSKSGYLLELDMTYRYYEEKSGFISSRKQAVAIKSPRCVSFEQAHYLARKYQDMEDALCSVDGYNEQTGMYYYDYLDMDSFARKYLMEEISKNLDASVTSFYMYIPENTSKFYAGPLWDYDRTFGTDFLRDGIDLKDPCTLYASENVYYEEADYPLLYLICQQEEFQDLYKDIYFREIRDDVVMIQKSFVDEHAERIEDSAMMDAIRWNTLVSTSDVEANRVEFQNRIAGIKDFMEQRIAFLDEEWQ